VGPTGVGTVKWASRVPRHVTGRVRRAGGFAAVSLLVLATPTAGVATAVGFGVIAAIAAFGDDEGPLFDLFARPGDRRDGQLLGLAGFSLAAAGLGLLATLPPTDRLPMAVYAVAVVAPAFGNLGAALVGESTADEFLASGGYVAAGAAAAVLAQAAVAVQTATLFDPPTAAFLATVGALVAGLFETVLYGRDDPLVVLSTGFGLWLVAAVSGAVDPLLVGVGVLVTVLLGSVSYALGTASVAGMLTGVLFGLLTVVLGGIEWFLVLIAFYAVGGLSTKYRYDEKVDRGVAEPNEGARGTGNVLANSAAAMLALLGFVAAGEHLPVPAEPLAYAFAGAVATALGDTLSSEIGGLFDGPRLITTLEPVEPGTDGAITWQGKLAGVVGAGVVAVVAAAGMAPGGTPAAAGIVLVAGVAGMTADSFLGATVEGGRFGNRAVNFLATLVGAVVAASLAGVL